MFGLAGALCHVHSLYVCAAAPSENTVMGKNVKLLQKQEKCVYLLKKKNV